ncbi:hypothetical protein BDV25DRAFT_142165 [Aspergillus avenaceus]|uniref:Uncharacterized protein n=1 Tax=Aspergillus avenaceus TaxID=36643 RepID=A0A5N6TNZ1_ASPAV|nr:hypothetical protein BDV25DRAFT_142165 [Aspergillus avenaceus]
MESTVRPPTTQKQWLALMKREDIDIESIHQKANFSSASKFGLHHFLTLRVLWKTVDIKSFNPSHFEEEDDEGNFFLAKVFQEEAYQVESTELSDNIILSPVSKHTRARKAGGVGSGLDTPSKANRSATSVEDLQLDDYMDEDIPSTPEVLSNESPFESIGSWANPSYGPKELWKVMIPRTKDEQIVNTALINFLRPITSNFPSLSDDWTIQQKEFKAKFDSGEYIARTDGHCKNKVKGDVRALVEVKACLRYLSLLEICIQESAQMVAWLKAFPPNPRRTSFSDRHEIWLIFARYDEGYLDYLKGDTTEGSPLPFMTMYQVGPWNTQSKEAMAHLGPILLALALRSHEENATKDEDHQGHY